LITTSNAPNSTIPSQLRRDEHRDETQALSKLISIANTSISKTNKSAYDAFLSLSDKQKILLVSRIYVIDDSPNIRDVENKIAQEIRLLSRFPDSLKSRLEGWWFKIAIDHLMSDEFNTIKGVELQRKKNSARMNEFLFINYA
jgi:hypothetical protein